jgi:hypothetical protein
MRLGLHHLRQLCLIIGCLKIVESLKKSYFEDEPPTALYLENLPLLE